MARQSNVTIAPVEGKLGVLIPGLGAVATTFIAGVEAVKKGLGIPVGSLTQLGTIRLGKRTEGRTPRINEFVPLAPLESLVFGGWDIYEDSAYQAATNARVLEASLLDQLKNELHAVRPMKAVFDQEYVKRIHGPNLKSGASKMELAEALMDDIRSFKTDHGCDRLVMIWCGSTEVFHRPAAVHQTLAAFEEGLKSNDPDIAPSQIYAYAALKLKVPFANGAPNLTTDTPALLELARGNGVAVCGKDFKTGQTYMKTLLAPGLKARMLGVNGWFSTNILGNRDGAVLEDPGSFKSKEETKLSVLEQILQPDLYPQLYKDLYHAVRINYYPPRGDSKEGWDNIDIFGWLGYPMQIKIDFLCRDSILAAPLVLDLVLFLDLAQRAALKGIQEWLSFYFKGPMTAQGLYPEHDIFIQLMKLKTHFDGCKVKSSLRTWDSNTTTDPGNGKTRRVLVIGGTQFIGKRLVEQLVLNGHEVDVLHRKNRHCFGKAVGNLVADRNDAATIRAAVGSSHYDAVYDLAYDWERGTTGRQIEATAQIFDGRVGRYIYMSSVAAYGDGLNHHEGDALAPDDHPDIYARNKAVSERALFRLQHKTGFPLVTLRPPFVYGPGNPYYREAFFWDRFRQGRPVILPSEGHRLMQFIYIDDLIDMAIKVMEPRNFAGQAFNTANPRPVTQHELVMLLARASGESQPEIVSIPRDVIQRNGGQAIGERLYFGYYYDLPAITEVVTKAQRMLGFKPTDFVTGLRNEHSAYLKKRGYPKPAFEFEDHLMRCNQAQGMATRSA